MKRIQTISTRMLSAEAKTYLREIHQNGAHENSIYFKRSEVGSWINIGAAIAALGIAFYVNDIMDAPKVQWWVVLLVTFGLLILALALHTIWVKRKSKQYLGDFELIDQSYWWDVGPHNVEMLALNGLTEISGHHKQKDGKYDGSVLNLKFSNENLEKIISDKSKAEVIFDYFDDCLTSNLIRDKQNIEKKSFDQIRFLLFVGFIFFGFIISYFCVPYISLLAKEKQMFFLAINDSQANVDDSDKYLKEFPQEYRFNEVLKYRDHRLFNIAENKLKSEKKITGIREYLTDNKNNLHRIEAQDLINKYYASAISLLKRKESDVTGESREMLRAFVGLIDSLKNESTPDVYVGFESKNIEKPTDKKGNLSEKEEYRDHLMMTPKLVEVEKNSSTGTAILPLGAAFNQTNVIRREDIILNRLSESISTILDGDVIKLKKCGTDSIELNKKPCRMIIKYYTQPSGSLYLYRNTHENGNKSEIKGLLRGYKIDWDLVLFDSNGKSLNTIRIKSEPLLQLRMQGSASDPSWAAYAVMMYSAFHGFSNELTTNFGLGAKDAPNYFSFDDATGKIDKTTSMVDQK